MDIRARSAPVRGGTPGKPRNHPEQNRFGSPDRPSTAGMEAVKVQMPTGFSKTEDLMAMSPIGDRCSSEKSLKVVDTRHGRRRGNNTVIGSEERFLWQKPTYCSDAIYDVTANIVKPRAAGFGSSTREDWKGIAENKRDTVNPYTGPGRYHIPDERNALSDAPAIKASPFGLSRRELVDLKNPSPGPVYTIDGIYRYGRDKKVGPGFNKDNRPPLEQDTLRCSTSAYYLPKPQKVGPSCTFPKDQNFRDRALNVHRSPGPIYDTTSHDFQTGPSYSFSASKSKRF